MLVLVVFILMLVWVPLVFGSSLLFVLSNGLLMLLIMMRMKLMVLVLVMLILILVWVPLVFGSSLLVVSRKVLLLMLMML